MTIICELQTTQEAKESREKGSQQLSSIHGAEPGTRGEHSEERDCLVVSVPSPLLTQNHLKTKHRLPVLCYCLGRYKDAVENLGLQPQLLICFGPRAALRI